MLAIKSNTLLPAATIVTVSILILCVLTQYLIGISLEDMKSDARLINIAEDQRVLAHQIVNEVAADNLGGIVSPIPVNKLTEQFRHLQTTLKEGDSSAGIPKPDSKLRSQELVMDTSFKKFFAQIGLIANADNTNTGVIELLARQEEYLKHLGAFIAAVNGLSESKIEKFQRTEIVIMLCSIAIVFVEVIFVLFPAIRKIKKKNMQLKAIAFNESHIIRQPLANIKSLLTLITECSDQNEKEELFKLVISETDKMDAVIFDTIAKTRT